MTGNVRIRALLLLIGLVVYKKVIEPKRGGAGKAEKVSKPGKAPKAGKMSKAAKPPKPGKEPKPPKASKEKARQTASSGRMGSVL